MNQKFNSNTKSILPNYIRALSWIKDNSLCGGVSISSLQKQPYPEVTGYLIPTLLENGEKEFAYKYAQFLSDVQQLNGSFKGPDNKEYFFDTAQALEGLFYAHLQWPEFETAILKALDYLSQQIGKNGKIFTNYNDAIPDDVCVYGLSKFLKVAKYFKRTQYQKKIIHSINYYKHQFKDINYLTHFTAYILDGFIEIGEKNLVIPHIKKIFESQKEDGSIPALPNVDWTCTVGLAQMAIIGYKVGMHDNADRALYYLCRVQNRSGGFYGSLGSGAKYFPKEEISWANKFFLDAINLKISSFFENYALTKFDEISGSDVRLQSIINFSKDRNPKNILDAGCGNGRFAKKIKNKFPNAKIYCLDISNKLLETAPKIFTKKQGNILNLPFKNNYFDIVYCVETLEHSLQPQIAIKELARVLKNDGRIIIIDKNSDCEGDLEITDFEQWFNRDFVDSYLNENGIITRSQILNSDRWDKDLFIVWFGTKNNYLDKNSWSNIINETPINNIVNKIKSCQFPSWIAPLIKYTNQGESILEFGSGSGELSAILATYNRRVNLLDYSLKNIIYSKKLFKKLNITANFYYKDITKKMHFKNNTFDWVFSSGLLEHFNDQQINNIIKESSRLSKKGVMSLVPNANAIFYRIGKYQMEKNNLWKYGYEKPAYSLKNFFKNAGLKNIIEYSIDPFHALNFIKDTKVIRNFYNSLSPDELNALNQGYLLFTYGEK